MALDAWGSSIQEAKLIALDACNKMALRDRINASCWVYAVGNYLTKPYSWRSSYFSSPPEALDFARRDIDSQVMTVTPTSQSVLGSLKVVLPNFDRIRQFGVKKGPYSTLEEINYVASTVDLVIKGYVKVLKRKNLFSPFSIQATYETSPPILSEEDYLLWFHLDSNSAEWYMLGHGWQQKKMIPHAAELEFFGKVYDQGWLTSIETEAKTNPPTRIVQENGVKNGVRPLVS